VATPTPTPTPTRTPTSPPGATPTPTRTPTPIPTAGSAGSGFYTVAPCRVIDTRKAFGALNGPALQAYATRLFTLTSSCGIPASALAVSANITVVPNGAGFLTLYPGNGVRPPSSNISFSTRRVRANSSLVYLATDGTGGVNIYNGSDSANDLILDVNGYFR
jgi:hypothetical protein